MSIRVFLSCHYILLLFMVALPVGGQPVNIDFSRVDIDTQEGPNSQNIKVLLRDSEGFMWVGTQNGLKRFDGIRSEYLGNLVKNDSLITDNIIEAIEEFPSRKEIWIATQRDGIYVYNSKEHTVTNLEGLPHVDSSGVRALYLSRDSSMWIGTTDAGLIRYRGKSTAVEYYLNASPDSSEEQLSISAIYEPENAPGRVFVGARSGFYIIDTRQDGNESTPRQFVLPTELDNSRVIGFAERNGKLWGSTALGLLFCYDINEQRVVDWFDASGLPGVERIDTIYPSAFYEDVLWIGTRGGGLLAFDVLAEKFRQYTAEKDVATSLSHPNALAIIEDYDGVLWVGAFEGLNKTRLDEIKFTPHRVRFEDGAPCADQPFVSVVSFLQSRYEKDKLWIGTLSAGLHRYDLNSNRYTSFLSCGTQPPHNVFSMYEDKAGRIWLGTSQPFLYEFDRTTGAINAYPTLPGQSYNTYQILELEKHPGLLWLATSSKGLLVFDVELGRVDRQYNKEATGSTYLPSNMIWQIMEDPHQSSVLWIATHDTGLYRLDVLTKEITPYNTGTDSCLPSDRMVSLSEGPDSTLWLGTFDAGFTNFDWQSGTCRPYSHADGLESHDVGGIMQDRFDRLWMTTSTKGISLFDPEIDSFTNFSEQDGLQGDKFYYPAKYQNEQGEIFIGGQKGYNFFQPDSIEVTGNIAPVRMTKMTVLGEPRFLYSSADTYNPIELNYKENDITFQFAALDLSRPQTNQYRVKLEPIDKEWQSVNDGVSPRYATLEPGQYTFSVMGSNGYGIWNPEPAVIAFNIIPPIWGRWWFIPALSILVISLVVGAFQYRIYHMNLEKNARSQIARDLHDDMGSKLGSLALRIEMTGLELDAENSLKKHLSELAEAERALVNDLRLIVWLVNFKFDTLPKLIDRMESEGGQMLRGKRLTFNKPDQIPDVGLDMSRRKHLFLFFKEALHNIVRHSQATYINIDISIDTDILSMSIIDDGIGFDPATATSSQGLLSMQVRADEIDGNYKIQSEPGKGTRITLKAPLKTKKSGIHVITRLWKAALQLTLDNVYKNVFRRQK